MIQTGCDASLPPQPPLSRGIHGGSAQRLQGYEPVQTFVVRMIYNSHAPFAQLVQDSVRPHFHAFGQRGRGRIAGLARRRRQRREGQGTRRIQCRIARQHHLYFLAQLIVPVALAREELLTAIGRKLDHRSGQRLDPLPARGTHDCDDTAKLARGQPFGAPAAFSAASGFISPLFSAACLSANPGRVEYHNGLR